MVAGILFFVAFFGLVFLLGLKVFELRRGIKPLSASRYRFDAYLRRKADSVVGFFRFLNWQTVRLLLVFLLFEMKNLLVLLIRRVRESNMGEMVSGKNIPNGNGAGTSSTFLREVSSIKETKTDSLK